MNLRNREINCKKSATCTAAICVAAMWCAKSDCAFFRKSVTVSTLKILVTFDWFSLLSRILSGGSSVESKRQCNELLS